MTIRIRPARAEDADLLPEIERSAGALFRTLPDLAWIAGGEVMSVGAHRAFIALGASFVAERDERLVGFLAGERVADDLHVWELAVHAAHRSHGIGRALMGAACAHARATGCAHVTLTTFRGVAWNEPFYARLGFVTLEGDVRGDFLISILAREAENGLPPERRCAMRLGL